MAPANTEGDCVPYPCYRCHPWFLFFLCLYASVVRPSSHQNVFGPVTVTVPSTNWPLMAVSAPLPFGALLFSELPEILQRKKFKVASLAVPPPTTSMLP